MYEADIKGGRPSIAPEKLMRAMLLQVLYSVRSERQLVEQISYNLLFRWFVGPVDRRRGVEPLGVQQEPRPADRARCGHGAVQRDGGDGRQARAALGRALQRGRHADSGLGQPQERAAQGRSDDDRPPEDWRGEPRSNDTHQSTTDDESRLYRKSNAAPALPSYLGHVLTDNRHGLVVNVRASQSNGTAEREVAADMLRDLGQRRKTRDGGRRQGLRHQGLRQGVSRDERDAARGAEHQPQLGAARLTGAPPGTPATRSASASASASSSASAGAR
jgi:hypothetical protein